MHAGARDRRITIESKTGTQSTTGSVTETWATLATVWAARRIPVASERFRAGQHEGRTVTVWNIRWRDDLDETMRVSYGGDYYEIDGLVELGRRSEIDILSARQISAT